MPGGHDHYYQPVLRGTPPNALVEAADPNPSEIGRRPEEMAGVVDSLTYSLATLTLFDSLAPEVRERSVHTIDVLLDWVDLSLEILAEQEDPVRPRLFTFTEIVTLALESMRAHTTKGWLQGRVDDQEYAEVSQLLLPHATVLLANAFNNLARGIEGEQEKLRALSALPRQVVPEPRPPT